MGYQIFLDMKLRSGTDAQELRYEIEIECLSEFIGSPSSWTKSADSTRARKYFRELDPRRRNNIPGMFSVK